MSFCIQQFYQFGADESNLWAQKGLKWGYGQSNAYKGTIYTVIGPDEGFYWFCGMATDRIPTVESYRWLRPVFGDEIHISNQVAFASYSGCGHNVFFKFTSEFRPPSTCPLGDAGYLNEQSTSLP